MSQVGMKFRFQTNNLDNDRLFEIVLMSQIIWQLN
jgi:hypothetical protein